MATFTYPYRYPYPVLRCENNRLMVRVGPYTDRNLQGVCDMIAYDVAHGGVKPEDIHPILHPGIREALKVMRNFYQKQVDEDEKNPPDPEWKAMFTDKNIEDVRRCDEFLTT